MYFAVVAKNCDQKETAENELVEQHQIAGKTSVWVYTSENHGSSIEVPVTPETTVKNILECVRDPVRGDGYLVAVAGDTDYILQEGDNAYTFLYEIWSSSGATPTFLLRYLNQQAEWPPPELEARRHQMRRPHDSSADLNKLPGGAGDLTLVELQEMASRQQQVVESQQQVLVAKEQRLKYLRQQEAHHAQLTSESERLRKIRERVENQELKLKKLRALRDQAEQFRINNGNLNSELEAVKNVFSEKEKELAMAVARVDQLTKQLKDLKNGANNGKFGSKQSAANSELEKLRKELLLRNKLNEQQNNMIAAKEKLLNDRHEKVALIDARIHKLQQRLKKRQLQEQQAGVQGAKVTKHINLNSSGNTGAPIESYGRNTSQDAKGDSFSKSGGLTNLDPRYQIFPPVTKFSSPGELEGSSTKQEDENISDGVEEYKLPVVLPAEKATHFQENIPRQNSSFSQRLPATDRSNKPVSALEGASNKTDNIPKIGSSLYSVVKQGALGPKNFPQASSGVGQHQRSHVSLGGEDGTSSDSGFSGKDASSSASSTLSPSGTSSTSSSYPIINISDEERQAGSGQSSPASSESSPNSGTGVQGKNINEQVNTSSIGPVSAMIEKLNKNVGQMDAQTQQTLSNMPASLKRLPFTQKPYGQSQEGNAVSHSSGRLLSTVPSAPNRQTRSYLNTQGLTVSLLPSTPQDGMNSSPLGNDSPHVQSPIASTGNSTVTTLNPNQTSVASSSGPHLNQKPALPYKYASKNTIANTYMGRLGSAAMEKYQKDLNRLYKSVDSQGSSDAPSSEDGTSSFFQSPSPDAMSAGQSHPQFGAAISSPSYPDIASDKGSFKLHTPKQVRRRHSDSENEDLNKVLQEQKDREQQQQQRLHQHQGGHDPSQDSRLPSEADPTSPPSDKSLVDKTKNVKTLQQTPSQESKQPESPSSIAPTNQKTGKAFSPAALSKSSSSLKVESVLRASKSNLKKDGSRKSNNRVSFDPLALLLDASLEGELDLVRKVALQVDDVSTPNDEGITALHNAICAGHYDVVTVLVEFGCDVNSPDSDGWTPLHCAASCNNLPMVRFLVEHGACVFATTISDHETAADKCEEEEDGYDSCSDYLYSIQEKLGIANNGEVYAVFDYQATNLDELSFRNRDKLTVLRKGDETEKEWWWAQVGEREGYIPRNLLGLYPRVVPKIKEVSEC